MPAPRMSRRTLFATTAAVGAAVAVPTRAHAGGLPDTLALPEGFQPEGIAIGGPFAYVGSLTDGSIWRANLFTGRGAILSPGPGTQSVGLKLDRRGRLFVAGGAAGDARVVSAVTGRVLASYRLADAGTGFINDVVLTLGAAWFTNSFQPLLYRVRRGEVTEVPLSGDFMQGEGFNANGIAPTPDGRALVVAQSSTGQLFRVDPSSGVATTVDLGGAAVPGPDGLLLRGRLLYVVHSAQVSVIRLDRTGRRGTVLTSVTDPRFETPTTVDAFAGRLYLPDARFTTEPTPTTPYFVYAIPIPPAG